MQLIGAADLVRLDDGNETGLGHRVLLDRGVRRSDWLKGVWL
jgi:hypothetical protein